VPFAALPGREGEIGGEAAGPVRVPGLLEGRPVQEDEPAGRVDLKT